VAELNGRVEAGPHEALNLLERTRMTRPIRIVVASLAGLVAMLAPSLDSAAATPAQLTQAQAQNVGTDAYVYGVDLLEFMRAWKLDTSVTVPNDYANAPVNQVGNQTVLTTPANQDREIVGPSNSTLYSSAHLDLSKGPIVLHVPEVPNHRYYAWEFLDPYLNVFHYVGTRTTGDGAGNYVIVGPGFKGKLPAGLTRINSTYEHIWLFGRTLVYGKRDLAAAHRIQDGYKTIPLKDFERAGLAYKPPRPHEAVTTPTIPSLPTGMAFFDALGSAMAENPPPARDHAIIAEMRTAGVGAGLTPTGEHLPAATVAGLTAAANGGPAYVFSQRLQIALGGAHQHNGWYQLLPDTGNFGTNYTYRAVIAMFGICANLPAEAIYAAGTLDNTGTTLNGSNSYVIQIPRAEMPPVRYFWSLTVYNLQTELIANHYGKYSVGSNTPLQHKKDGSVDIYVQPTPPAGHETNWLPDVPNTPMVLVLRMYGPKSNVLNGTYQYPTIERVG
jgi:hypothetical protein